MSTISSVPDTKVRDLVDCEGVKSASKGTVTTSPLTSPEDVEQGRVERGLQRGGWGRVPIIFSFFFRDGVQVGGKVLRGTGFCSFRRYLCYTRRLGSDVHLKIGSFDNEDISVRKTILFKGKW